MKINIKVIPRAKHIRVEKQVDGLKVWLTASAVDGKANEQLYEVLSEYFDKPKSTIQIIRGNSSRKKVVLFL